MPQRTRGARPTGLAVSNQPDAMAASDLFAGQIEDVAVKAANRRAEHVQDIAAGSSVAPNGRYRGRDDDKLTVRIERIPIRVWTCPAGLGVDVVNKR